MKINGIEKLDWLMIVMLIFVLATVIDYNAMDMQDMILLGSIIIWFITLLIRLYLINFRNK